MKYRLLACLIFLIAINCEKSFCPIQVQKSPQIIFTSETEDNADIFIVDRNGNNKINLTNTTHAMEYAPIFVPRSSKIVYIYKQTKFSYEKIYVMDNDGANRRLLTEGSFRYTGPIHPISECAILFRIIYNLNSDISIMNTVSKEIKRLTNAYEMIGDFELNANCDKVVFQTNRDSSFQIYSMDIDGENQINLTNSINKDLSPHFSPDGNNIIYVTEIGDNREIFIMDINGNNKKNLTNCERRDDFPQVSPDGSKIVYTSFLENNAEIFLMDIDGSNQINLTNRVSDDRNPKFSPDGLSIFFETNRDGNVEIYRMDLNGNKLVNISRNLGKDYSPQFQGI